MWYEYRLIPVENSVPALEKAVNLQAQQETGENTGFQLKTIIASGTKLIAVMEASRLEYEPELEKEVKFEQTA